MNINYSTNTTTLTDLTVYINVSAISFEGIGPVNTVKAEQAACFCQLRFVLTKLCNERFSKIFH